MLFLFVGDHEHETNNSHVRVFKNKTSGTHCLKIVFKSLVCVMFLLLQDSRDDEESSSDDDDNDVPENQRAKWGRLCNEIAVPGGTLKAYINDEGVMRCVAHCCSHGPKCKKERTFMESDIGRKAQGRPLGLLCALLARHSRPECSDHRSHKRRYKIPRRERCEARQHFEGVPGSDNLLQYEREQGGDEETEPWKQP